MGLSLRSSVLQRQAAVLPPALEVGSFVEEARVVRVDAKLGVYMALPEQAGVTAFAHISRPVKTPPTSCDSSQFPSTLLEPAPLFAALKRGC